MSSNFNPSLHQLFINFPFLVQTPTSIIGQKMLFNFCVFFIYCRSLSLPKSCVPRWRTSKDSWRISLPSHGRSSTAELSVVILLSFVSTWVSSTLYRPSQMYIKRSPCQSLNVIGHLDVSVAIILCWTMMRCPRLTSWLKYLFCMLFHYFKTWVLCFL